LFCFILLCSPQNSHKQYNRVRGLESHPDIFGFAGVNAALLFAHELGVHHRRRVQGDGHFAHHDKALVQGVGQCGPDEQLRGLNLRVRSP